MKKQTVTHWTRPDELIKSGYGMITYSEWCERERARINARGDGVKIVRRQDGMIALSR
jgi:hypothetical protein